MDYKRSTREVRFTTRQGLDESKQAYEVDKATTARDKNFIRDDIAAGKDYEGALNFWDKVKGRGDQEVVDFWEQVSPTIKQFAGKDFWDAKKLQEDIQFDETLAEMRGQSIEEKQQRRDAVSAYMASDMQIDGKRAGIVDWAAKNGHEEYATWVQGLSRGGRTAVMSQLMSTELASFAENLTQALAGDEKIYTYYPKDGKPIKFSGQDVYENSEYLSALIDHEQRLFYDIASGGRKYNRKRIADLIDTKVEPIAEQFRLGALQKIRVSNAKNAISEIVADIPNIFNLNTENDGDGFEINTTKDGELTPAFKLKMSTLAEQLRTQVGLTGESSDITGTVTNHIAVGLKRWTDSKGNSKAAMDFVNEVLGVYRTKNTVWFKDSTTGEHTTFSEKWPTKFSKTGNWHTTALNGHSLQGAQSGAASVGISGVTDNNGSTGIGNTEAVTIAEQALTVSSQPNSLPWTIAEDPDLSLNAGKDEKERTANSIYVYQSGKVTVNSKYNGTLKGKIAELIINGKPVPQDLEEEIVKLFHNDPKLMGNHTLKAQILDFARSTKTTFQTETILNRALDNPTANLIVDKKIRKSDLEKMGLNNKTAMKWLEDNKIEIVDYIYGDDNNGEEKLIVSTRISDLIKPYNLKPGHEQKLFTKLESKVSAIINADQSGNVPGRTREVIRNQALDQVITEFNGVQTSGDIKQNLYINRKTRTVPNLVDKGFFGNVHKGKLNALANEGIVRRANSLRDSDVDITESDVFNYSDLETANKHIERFNGLPRTTMEIFAKEGKNPYIAYKKYVENFNRKNPENPIELSDTFNTLYELNKNISGSTLNTILKYAKHSSNNRVSNVSLARILDKEFNLTTGIRVGPFGIGTGINLPRTTDLVTALNVLPLNHDDNSLHGTERQIGSYGMLESDVKAAYVRAYPGKRFDPNEFFRDKKIQKELAINQLNFILNGIRSKKEGTLDMTNAGLMREVYRQFITGNNQEIDKAVLLNRGSNFLNNVNRNYSGGGPAEFTYLGPQFYPF